jgi:hypothetical protein
MELVEQWHTCSSDDVGFIMIRSLGDVVKCLKGAYVYTVVLLRDVVRGV